MLLAVDVGNTQSHVGVFDGDELVGDWRFATRGDSTADELALAIHGSLEFRELELDQLDGAIVSTVVPRLGPEYVRLCERHLGARCLLVGSSVKTGMPILIDNPRELGSDRLVNAVAAYERVGGPCVSIDFGTSTNFDAVSDDGEYLGGVIGPGLQISIEALAGRHREAAADRAGRARGRDRQGHPAALQSGFVFGFAGLVDGITRRMLAELGGEPTVLRDRRPGRRDRAALRDGRRGRSLPDPARA